MQSSSVLFKPSLRRLGLYLCPAILLYGFVVIVPILNAFWYSLHSAINFKLKWIGLNNYAQLLNDSDFWRSFGHNLIILGLSLVFQICLAFIVAAMMTNKQIRLARLYRAVMFFPVVLSSIVVGFVWVLIYNIDAGLLNSILRAIGLGAATRLWLDDPNIVIYSVTVPLIWQFLGFFLVIFLAGFSNIPEELLEAAEIDGANGFQKTVQVTLPLMVNTWKVVLILAISGAIKVFEQPFVMTRGGPGLSSTVLAQYAYTTSFVRTDYAYGSAVAVGMLVLSFTLIGLTSLLLDRVVFRGKTDV